MSKEVKSISLDKLVAHPDNPNRMSRANFVKLVRNIQRTGRYEPLIVRPFPERINRQERKEHKEKNRDLKLKIKKSNSANSAVRTRECFQIINGEHRYKALSELGYKEADCIVWDVDDEQTDILLATLNRLCGADKLDKKIKLLERLNSRMKSVELARVLPQTAKQIERLGNLKMPSAPARMTGRFANPMIFFVTEKQQQIIEEALSLTVQGDCKETKAQRRAAGLVIIAESFINKSGKTSEG